MNGSGTPPPEPLFCRSRPRVLARVTSPPLPIPPQPGRSDADPDVSAQRSFVACGDLAGEGLACRRGDRLVFARLDFRVAAGDALLLTGANGSGKSSLLRLMAGLLTPVAGRLSWGGQPLSRDPAAWHAALHYVGHLDATKPALTPREMLLYWTALHSRDGEPALPAALAAFGLAHIADWPCRWLSAGQRRRLALARLLATPAPIWLLDEPTAALDNDGEARLATAIAEHRARGGRVAVATHQPLDLDGVHELRLDAYAASPEDALVAAW
jgi:heme exporter protein A